MHACRFMNHVKVNLYTHCINSRITCMFTQLHGKVDFHQLNRKYKTIQICFYEVKHRSTYKLIEKNHPTDSGIIRK